MSCKEKKKIIVKKIVDNSTAVEITKKVYYHNTIARMNNKFSLEEEKALHIIFSHIKPFNHENATTVQIEKKKFFKYLNLVGKSKYKTYEKITDNLIFKSFVKIENDTAKKKGIILTTSEWNTRQPYFEVSLNPNFMPYLEQLKEHYTKVDLKTVCAFKSKHALTLYKFICSWNNDNDKINNRYQTTKELKDMFGLSKETYVENGKFKRAKFERYTVDTAINEINQHSDLSISYHKHKNGNKVENYEFKWSKKVKENDKSTKQETKKKPKTQNTMSKEEIQQALEDFDNS